MTRVRRFLSTPTTLVMRTRLMLILVRLTTIFSLVGRIFKGNFGLTRTSPRVFLRDRASSSRKFFKSFGTVLRFSSLVSASVFGINAVLLVAG